MSTLTLRARVSDRAVWLWSAAQLDLTGYRLWAQGRGGVYTHSLAGAVAATAEALGGPGTRGQQ